MVSQPLLVVIVAGDCPGQCRAFSSILGFPDGSTVKNLIAKQETWVQSLGREDPPEEGMATHSSILAWEIPWTEEPGELQSMGLQRVECELATTQQTNKHHDPMVSQNSWVWRNEAAIYKPQNTSNLNF